MKVLILGGTGAMGRYLVDILAAKGDEVFVTSRSPHSTSYMNIHYFLGNGRNLEFLSDILVEGYDVIVDFMLYGYDEFESKIELLLKSTDQYFFLSSSRVFAKSDVPLKDESPRLLDVCEDEEYISTNEYALRKAREENLLRESGFKNWTIIRPYITYSDQRLQLGVFEKEQWLYRALQEKTILFPRDFAERRTTLSYGYDVAYVISKLMGNKGAFGEAFNIASPTSIRWSDVLELYLGVIEEVAGFRPKVQYVDDLTSIAKVLNNYYQIYYDRMYDRVFDSSKVDLIVGEKIEYMEPQIGLELCLRRFLSEGLEFKKISSKWEDYVDEVTGEYTY